MAQDNEFDYELIFEGLVDEAPETLQKIKGAFIADLELSVLEVQEILANPPSTICKIPEQGKAKRFCQILTQAGGKIRLVEPLQDLESVLDDSAFEIPENDLLSELDGIDIPTRLVVPESKVKLPEEKKEEKPTTSSINTGPKEVSIKSTLKGDKTFDLDHEEEMLSTGNTVELKEGDIEPLDLGFDLDVEDDKPKAANNQAESKDHPAKKENTKHSEIAAALSDEMEDLISLSLADDSLGSETPEEEADRALNVEGNLTAVQAKGIPTEPNMSEDDLTLDLSEPEEPVKATKPVKETEAASDKDKDTPFFEFDDLKDAVDTVKTKEEPSSPPSSTVEDDNDDLVFQLDEPVEETTPPAAEEAKSVEKAEEEDFGLEFSLDDHSAEAPAKPKKEQKEPELTATPAVATSETPSAGLAIDNDQAPAEEKPATAAEATPQSQTPPVGTIKLSETMQKKAPKKPEVKTEDSEEDAKQAAEDSSEESDADQDEDKGLSFVVEWILPIVVATIPLVIGTYWWFFGFGTPEVEPLPEVIVHKTQQKSDQVSGEEKTKAPEMRKFTLAGKDSTAKVETDAKFVIDGPKVVSATIFLSTPEPRELTPEEIVTRKQRDPWLNKVIADNLTFSEIKDGKLSASGKAKAYIAGKRILTRADLSGNWNLETKELTGEIRLVHNFSIKKTTKPGYQVERLDDNKYSFYVTGKVSAKVLTKEAKKESTVE